MKRQHLPSLLLLASVLSLSGCGKTSTFDKKIDMDYISSNAVLGNDYFAPNTFNLNVLVGKTADLFVDAIPDSFAKEAVYKSADTSIATVDASGKVTGVKKGITSIEVSAKDGSRKETVFVYVTETVTNANALTIMNTISDNTKKGSYVADKTIKSYEIVHQDMSRDGVVYNSQKFIETLAIADTERDTYFEVSSEDIYVKTANGAPEVSSGTWRFFVDHDSWVTYLLHETPSARRYMELNTQSYMGGSRIDVLYDILDMFFVSGRSIITDMYEDASGKEEDGPIDFITDCLTTSYSNVKQSYSTSNGEDELYCNLDLTYEDQVISAQDEFDIEIPAGTVCQELVKSTYAFDYDRILGWNYEAIIDYEQDGKPCARNFGKSVRYDREFECVYPDLKEYSQVDSIYDL